MCFSLFKQPIIAVAANDRLRYEAFMAFEWDEAKNRANITKHGVSLKSANRIFAGPVPTPVR